MVGGVGRGVGGVVHAVVGVVRVGGVHGGVRARGVNLQFSVFTLL